MSSSVSSSPIGEDEVGIELGRDLAGDCAFVDARLADLHHLLALEHLQVEVCVNW
jgi:hypothetical protein